MKKSIFLFFAAILCSLSAGAATERVYFVNASNWSTINVHAWDGTATGTSWPGNTATKDTWQWEGKDVYYFEAEAGAYKKCIFNNGNEQQTADLPWTANQVYDHNSQSWLPVEVAQATTTGTTVYFVNTENWNPVNVYAFSKYPSEINNSWPGVAATKESYQIGGFDVYSYKITKEFDYCIFNNGSQQSADLPWYQGKYYAPSKNTWYDDKAAAEEALAVPVADVTVHFINTPNWAEVACHHWIPNGAGTSWPGEVMTKETEQIAGCDVYTLTFTGEHPKCIFNNNKESGASQTGDLDVQDGKYYALSTQTWYDTKADAENALATPLPDETVYFVNNKSWTKVQVYGFEGSKGNADPAWPGTDITTNKTGEKVGEYDVYSFTAKQGEYAKIIFNNKEGDTGEQTNNLVWTNGKYYYMEAPTDYEGGTADEVKTAIDNLVTYDYYIADNGSLSGNADWSSKAIGLTDDNSDGVYEKTFTAQAAGTYLLKVTNGTWNDGYVWGFSDVEGAYEEVNAGESDNNIEIQLTTATTFTVKFDKNAKKISFDGLTPVTTTLTYRVKVPEGTEACYIAGPCNSWAFREMTREGTTNIFTIDIVGAKETDEYKYACKEDWAYAEVIEGGGNRTVWQELDQVEEWGKPVIVTYQLKGVGGWEQPGIELVQNPGNDKEYMLTCQAISATDAIKVVRLEDGEIKDYYGNGTVKDNVEVTVNYDDAGNITLPEGKYNFYFDTNASEKKLWIEAATDCQTTEEKTIFIEEGLEYSVNGTTVTITGLYNDELFELEISNCDINNLEDQTCPITMLIGKFGANGYVENQNATVAVWFSGYIQVTATGLQDYDNSNITYNIDITAAPAEEGLSEINVEVYDAVCTIDDNNTLTMLSMTAGVQVDVYNFDRTVNMAAYDYQLYTFDGMASGNTQVAVDGNTVSIYVETMGVDNDNHEIPVIAYVSGELPAEEDPTQPQTIDVKVTDLVVEDNVVMGTGSNFTFVLTLVDYAGEDGTYDLSDESFVRSGMSLRSYAATGSLTKAVDEYYRTYFMGTIQATVGETPFTFNLTMVSETKEEDIAAAATVTYNEENDVVFSANWNGTPISITLEGFENVAEKQYGELILSIGTGEDEFYAFGEPIAYVDGKEISIEGEFYSYSTETTYNVALWGTLPDYTRTVAQNQWGTICLPNASSSFTGATFYEVSSLDPAKGLWLDQLAAGAQLEAGKPYIFQATATEITVTYTDAAPVGAPQAGANGLTGTFTDIAAAEDGVLVGNYIIGGNKVHVATAQNDLPANRAYIDAALVPNKVQAKIPGRRRVCMGENATTGLDQIVAPEGQAVKAIVNGQLIIIRDGVKYNVQGQKL